MICFVILSSGNIFVVRQVCEKYREYCRTAWHVFVDYRQAYDSVHRPSLWSILQHFQVPMKLIRLIKACYTNSRGRVKVGGELTEAFGVESGLRQGCPLSCMLFNVALEWVVQQTPPSPDAITFTNGLQLDRLAYADDADLVGESFVGRDDQLENFNGAGTMIGLQVNEPKTKAMKASRDEQTEDFIELSSFLLEEVGTFKYLRSVIHRDATMEHEIEARIAAASKCSWAVKSLLQSRLLTRTTKIQVYLTIVHPVATYACECWTLTKELERRLLVFEHGILRRILGGVRDEETGQWRRRHNAELRELTQLPPRVVNV